MRMDARISIIPRTSRMAACAAEHAESSAAGERALAQARLQCKQANALQQPLPWLHARVWPVKARQPFHSSFTTDRRPPLRSRVGCTHIKRTSCRPHLLRTRTFSAPMGQKLGLV